MVSTVADLCGIADYTRTVVEALVNIGVDVAVHSLDRERRNQQGFYRRLASELCSSSADLIHLQHEYSFFGGVIPPLADVRVLRRAGFPLLAPSSYFDFVDRITLPMVVTCHEVSGPARVSRARHGVRHSLASAIERESTSLTFQAADQVICHGDTRVRMLADLGVAPQRLRMIPAGIPALSPPPRASARAALGVEDRFVLLSYGFVSPRKQIEMQIDAVAALPRTAILVVAGAILGDSRYLSKLSAHAESRGVSDRVRFVGEVSDSEKLTWLAAADLGLVTPVGMGAASTSINACAGAGVPVIASALPEANELQGRMHCLDLVSPGNCDQLVSRILFWMAHHEELAHARRATLASLRLATPAAEAGSTVQVYNDALRGTRPRHRGWSWVALARRYYAEGLCDRAVTPPLL